MENMADSVLAWSALAIALVWSVGAYNRLVRLRTQVIVAFAVLDGRLAHYLALTDEYLKEASGLALAQAVATPQGGDPATVWVGLQGAGTQFEASLKVARRKPLDAAAMAALQTAHVTLHGSWLRVQDESRDYRNLLRPSVQPGWTENALLVTQASAGFNRVVLAHNAAIGQFPALLLANVFGFRPAGCL